jgi:hypothetical protein
VKNAYVNKIVKDGTTICEINTEWLEIANQSNIKDFHLKIRDSIT